MKKIILAILSIALFAFVAVSCEEPVTPSNPVTPVTPTPSPTPEKVELKSIVITPDTLKMVVGEEATAKYVLDPSDYNGAFGSINQGGSKGGKVQLTRDDKAQTITVKAIKAGRYFYSFGTMSVDSNKLIILVSDPQLSSDAQVK